MTKYGFMTNQRVQDKNTIKIGYIENMNALKLRTISSVLVKFDDGSKRIYVDLEQQNLLPYPNDYFNIPPENKTNIKF